MLDTSCGAASVLTDCLHDLFHPFHGSVVQILLPNHFLEEASEAQGHYTSFPNKMQFLAQLLFEYRYA